MGRLSGKVAFITGAGAGIAKASALAFAREGAKVALAEIKSELGRATEKQILAAGGDAIFYETDVTQDESIKQAIDAAAARYGRLDILMNCAGGSLVEDVPVHQMDLAIFERTIALNLRHPFLCCRHGIPHMIASGGGSIINFSTWLALIGQEKPIYAAAKGGIVAFTRTLATEYMKDGIRANAPSAPSRVGKIPNPVPPSRPLKHRRAMRRIASCIRFRWRSRRTSPTWRCFSRRTNRAVLLAR